MRRLLCITAHPDDESASFGGTLLHYAERGVETHVLCLTPGQAAKNRGNAKSDEELAAVRRGEFEAGCRILHVTHAKVLDYPDAGLAYVNFYKAAEEITLYMRSISPQVVMTFGPEGAVTTHPDHTMVSLFATLAFHWAGRKERFAEQLAAGIKPYQPQKLYYATAPFPLPHYQPACLASATAIIQMPEHLDAKIAAFRAHATQLPLADAVEKTLRQRGGEEWFHLVASMKPGKVEMETDLFAGVKD